MLHCFVRLRVWWVRGTGWVGLGVAEAVLGGRSECSFGVPGDGKLDDREDEQQGKWNDGDGLDRRVASFVALLLTLVVERSGLVFCAHSD
jgi:hypothetical protein